MGGKIWGKVGKKGPREIIDMAVWIKDGILYISSQGLPAKHMMKN
jgi:hypothetical protein